MNSLFLDIPESLRFIMKVPGGKKCLEENFSYLSDNEMINSLAGEDISGKLNLEKRPRLRDAIAKNFFIKKILESPDLESLFMSIAKEYELISLFIKTGNKCNHECKDYCMLKGNPNGKSIDLDNYKIFIDKYSTWLQSVGCLYFVGQEFLLMDDFEIYLEEAIKKGITNFRIITRGAGSKSDNNHALKKISALKQKYPFFSLFLTTSLDRYSTLNGKNHDEMLKNIYNIIKTHLDVFGEKIAYIQATGNVMRENGIAELDMASIGHITDDMNAILRYFEKDGITHTGTKITANMTILTLSNGKKLELKLSKMKNTYDEPRYSDIALNSGEMKGTKCKMINDPFNIYLDDELNLVTCTGFHGMFYHKDTSLINTVSEPNKDVFKTFMETRKRVFGAMSYSELAEYHNDPKDIHICDNI